mmetsp:Transcript_44982/g.101203  ORF Transcript_44982/g.101203 Transcript_44982/m.101203 type:complete len:296 (+) Transcript_44982:1026-1913(+)
MEFVCREVCNEPQGLDDDFDVINLPAAHHVQGVLGAPLEQILDVFTTAPGHSKEGHVSDAKTAVADNCAGVPVLAGKDRVVLPWVTEVTLVEHGNERVQQHLGRDWDDRLVDKPAWQPWRWQVLLACDEVHLLATVLHARADVLHREGPVAENGTTIAVDVVEGDVVVHSIANLDVGVFLTRIVDDARGEVGTRVVVKNVRVDLLLVLWSAFGLDGQNVVAIKIADLANDLQFLGLVPEVDVGIQVVTLRGMREARKHLILLWPCGPLSWVTKPLVLAPLRAPPDVESSHLRLQL